VIISAQIESEMALLDDEEQAEYLGAIGLSEPGLNRLIRSGYALLGLKTYFTVGPKEARAWTFREGWTAPRRKRSWQSAPRRQRISRQRWRHHAL